MTEQQARRGRLVARAGLWSAYPARTRPVSLVARLLPPLVAVLAALLKQAVGAGLTARGLDENGEPRRNLPDRPQKN